MLNVKGSIGAESSFPMRHFKYEMICYGSKKDNCSKYITNDKLLRTAPGGRWVTKHKFDHNVKLSRVSQFTSAPQALLRKPVKAPPPTTQAPPPVKSPVKTGKLLVCMKAYNNKHYVVAESNKKTVNANRPHCQAWERHTLIDLNGGTLINGDKIALRTHWGRYWSAQPNGRLEANRTALKSWETFTIRKVGGPGGKVISYGSKVGFLGAHRKYVVAENAGGKIVNVNRPHMKQWETFTLVKPSAKPKPT